MGGRDFCMRLYLCGRSALSMLRYLRGIRDDRLLEPPSRIRSLAEAVHGVRDLRSLSHRSELIIGHAGETVHALVPKKQMVVSYDSIATHLWSAKVPSGAFIKLTDDLYVSSPAFLFLQMARELDEIGLCRLGLELCGTYSLPERHAPYVPGSVDETLYELLPATTAKKILSLCGAVDDSVPGARKAKMVAGWLVDGAASPMEAATYMMLCLPKRKGGYGLPKPLLNPEVKVSTSTGEERRYPDLYWERESVDIEYQSDLAHGGDWNHYRDSKRQVTLTVNRITVLPLTKTQVYSTADFHELAIGLHRLLGIQVRCFNQKWESRRDDLRSAVLESRSV